MEIVGLAVVCLLVGLIGFGTLISVLSFCIISFSHTAIRLKPFDFVGRIYLGMHSPIDIMGGLAFGLIILAFWLRVHDHVDGFITGGQNGTVGTNLMDATFRS